MSYFSSTDDQLFNGAIGCGSGCGCHSCQSTINGLHQWYEKEEEEPEVQAQSPTQSQTSRPLAGWASPRFSDFNAPLYGRTALGANLHGLRDVDPEALKAQRELMERRDELMRRGLEQQRQEERESHRRNLELLERGAYEQAVKAITHELQLSPKEGFIKGSPQRYRLEQGFNKIPESRAHEFLMRLQSKTDPLGGLFRYRLATPTQKALLMILCRKISSPGQCDAPVTRTMAPHPSEAQKVPQSCPPYRIRKNDPRYPGKEIHCEFLPGASAPPFDCKYMCYP